MNPGQFNRRIKFIQQISAQNVYGGTIPSYTDILTTWGALEPLRQYNQFALSAGASVLNGDVTLKIRYRDSFKPTKGMYFQDISTPNEPSSVYTILVVSPFYPGTKQAFENSQETVYQNKLFIYIIGVKMDDSYQKLFS